MLQRRPPNSRLHSKEADSGEDAGSNRPLTLDAAAIAVRFMDVKNSPWA